MPFNSSLESIHVLLCGHRVIVCRVVSRLDHHVVDHAFVYQVEIRKPETDLQAPEDEERCVQFPLCWFTFFFAVLVVACWPAYTFTI